jgi:hypothetical protein
MQARQPGGVYRHPNPNQLKEGGTDRTRQASLNYRNLINDSMTWADVSASLAKVSEAYAQARGFVRTSRGEIENREGTTKCKAPHAKEKLQTLESGFNEAVLTFFGTFGAPEKEWNHEPEIAKLTERMHSDQAKAERVKVAGFAELCAGLLARLTYTTLNPYPHRDELLERIVDSENRYSRLASGLKNLSDETQLPRLEADFDSLVTDLADIEKKIHMEGRRRSLRMVWPIISLVLFVVVVVQVVFRATDAATIAAVIVVVSLGVGLVLAASNSLLAQFRIARRREKVLTVLGPPALAIVSVVASFYSATSQGQTYAPSQIAPNFFLGLFFSMVLLSSRLAQMRKVFIQKETTSFMRAFEEGPSKSP